MTTFFIGIDIAKSSFDAAFSLNERWHHRCFKNTVVGFKQFERWFSRYAITVSSAHLCMEATGSYSKALALWLFNKQYRVSVVNPVRIKCFGQSELMRNKNAKIDAKLVARLPGYAARNLETLS